MHQSRASGQNPGAVGGSTLQLLNPSAAPYSALTPPIDLASDPFSSARTHHFRPSGAPESSSSDAYGGGSFHTLRTLHHGHVGPASGLDSPVMGRPAGRYFDEYDEDEVDRRAGGTGMSRSSSSSSLMVLGKVAPSSSRANPGASAIRAVPAARPRSASTIIDITPSGSSLRPPGQSSAAYKSGTPSNRSRSSSIASVASNRSIASGLHVGGSGSSSSGGGGRTSVLRQAGGLRGLFLDRPVLAAVLEGVGIMLACAVVGGLVVWWVLPPVDGEDREKIKLPTSFEQLKDLNQVLQVRHASAPRLTFLSRLTILSLRGAGLQEPTLLARARVVLHHLPLPPDVFVARVHVPLYPRWRHVRRPAGVASHLRARRVSRFLCIFGWVSTVLNMVSTRRTGALLCYSLSAVIGGPILTHSARWRHKLESWRIKIASRTSSYDLFSYLVILRISPLPPHWVVNLLAPHLGIPRGIFWASTFVGIAGISLIHVQIGTTLDSMTGPDDFNLLSVKNLAGLAAIALAAMVPVGLRWYWRGEIQDAADDADDGEEGSTLHRGGAGGISSARTSTSSTRPLRSSSSTSRLVKDDEVAIPATIIDAGEDTADEEDDRSLLDRPSTDGDLTSGEEDDTARYLGPSGRGQGGQNGVLGSPIKVRSAPTANGGPAAPTGKAAKILGVDDTSAKGSSR